MPDAGSTSGVDPAASMSLLTSLLANPLDAGYVHYRATHGPRPATLLGRVGVFVVALALGFSSVVATQSLRAPAGDVKADLKEQASRRSAQVEDLNNDVQSLGRAIEQYANPSTVTKTDSALALQRNCCCVWSGHHCDADGSKWTREGQRRRARPRSGDGRQRSVGSRRRGYLD